MLGGLVGLRERPTTSEQPSLPTASGGKSERKMRTVGAAAKRTSVRRRATETQLRGSGHLPRATSTKDWAGSPLENSCWVVLNIPDLELRKDDEEVADVLASSAGSSMPSPSSPLQSTWLPSVDGLPGLRCLELVGSDLPLANFFGAGVVETEDSWGVEVDAGLSGTDLVGD
jgi:hypothetical protein